MPKHSVTAFALTVYLLAPAFGAAQDAAPESAPSDLLLILDASGSMWGQIGGENKIVIARRVLGDLLETLPDGADVGLIAYGHRREGDCADIETVVPMGPLDRPALQATVDSLNPRGKTPITASVESAFAVLAERGSPATVILVSDGLETCGGDPCAAVAAAREKGIEFKLHVVGFGIEEGDVSQLECAAQAGGGLYLPAADAGQLADALGQAVEASVRPDEPPATLAVGAVADGAPADAMVLVLDPETGDQVVAGRTYIGPETNPRRLPVPPGTWSVVVRALGLEGEPTVRFDAVEVPGDPIVERRADFTSGELAVGVTRNGALSDASVRIARPGEDASVDAGRTYNHASSNPSVFRLTPGVYAVTIESLEVAGAPSRTWEELVVRPGERTEVAHDYPSGELAIGVVDGDTLVDATVNVSRDGATVAAGRTYTSDSSNPRRFVLTPGTYTVHVQPLKHEDNAPRDLEVTVEPGGTAAETVRLGGG